LKVFKFILKTYLNINYIKDFSDNYNKIINNIKDFLNKINYIKN